METTPGRSTNLCHCYILPLLFFLHAIQSVLITDVFPLLILQLAGLLLSASSLGCCPQVMRAIRKEKARLRGHGVANAVPRSYAQPRSKGGTFARKSTTAIFVEGTVSSAHLPGKCWQLRDVCGTAGAASPGSGGAGVAHRAFSSVCRGEDGGRTPSAVASGWATAGAHCRFGR